MCASYLIKQRNPDRLGIEFETHVYLGDYIHDRILPYRMAPVIYPERDENGHDLLVFGEKQFSLVPSKRVKFGHAQRPT